MIILASNRSVHQQKAAGHPWESRPAYLSSVSVDAEPQKFAAYFSRSIAQNHNDIVDELKRHRAFATAENYQALRMAMSEFRDRVAPALSEVFIRRNFSHRLQIESDTTSVPSHHLKLQQKLAALRPRDLPSGLIPRMGWMCGAEWSCCHFVMPEARAMLGKEQWKHAAAAIDQLQFSESDEEQFCAGARAALSVFKHLVACAFSELGHAS